MATGPGRSRESAEKEKKPEEPRQGAADGEACRCKETAQMSPRELLERMMQDLAFWKKEKK